MSLSCSVSVFDGFVPIYPSITSMLREDSDMVIFLPTDMTRIAVKSDSDITTHQ